MTKLCNPFIGFTGVNTQFTGGHQSSHTHTHTPCRNPTMTASRLCLWQQNGRNVFTSFNAPILCVCDRLIHNGVFHFIFTIRITCSAIPHHNTGQEQSKPSPLSCPQIKNRVTTPASIWEQTTGRMTTPPFHAGRMAIAIPLTD